MNQQKNQKTMQNNSKNPYANSKSKEVRPTLRPGGGGAGRMMPGEKPRDFKGSMKQLIGYLGPYRWSILVMLLMAAGGTVFSIFGPRTLGQATTELYLGVMRMVQGNPLGIDLAKIGTILDNHPELKEKAEKGEILFGNIDTWVIWNLTGGPRGGVHVTDVTNASRTFMMNLETLDWDPEMLKILGIPRAMLPDIKASSQVYGYVKGGDLDGIPVAGDLGDQQAALFGQTCYSPGEAKNTYGTGCFMLMNTGNKPIQSKNGLLTTLGYKIGNEPAVYALEGSIAITGALVQWLRDNLKMIEKSSDIEMLANSVEDAGGIYFVPAFSGLYAPYWKSDARGAIVGLTRYINSGHLARAVLEATAYQTAEVLEAMNKDSGVDLTALKVDGGMVFNETLMQFQSDILGVPVIRPTVAETTALGAAYAAGLAVGFWEKVEDLRVNWGKDKEWEPKMDEETRAKLYKGWKKAVTRTFDWVEN